MRAARPATAGATYFAIVFAAGFALGTIRVLVTAPAIGELPAVLLEAPLMLWVSWIACGLCVRRFDLAGRPALAMAVGAEAFVLLLLAELALALTLFGRTPRQQLAARLAPAGLTGLAAQIAFGAMPAIRAALSSTAGAAQRSSSSS
jgi:hypothetical protein